MTDARVDALLRRLDVDASPDPAFADRTLALLEPLVRDARVRDASRLRWAAPRWALRRGGGWSASWGRARRLRWALALGLLIALGVATLALVGAQPSPIRYSGVFTPTGPMTTARSGHTATRLADGRVLILGGDDADPGGPSPAGFASAELYEPATGTFRRVGSVPVPLDGHSATLLADGRVLIAGGFTDTRLAQAELYDPRTGSFEPTGPMTRPREFPTATLLADGRVLVVGGAIDSYDTAESYDPRSGTFTATDSDPLYTGTATLLADGRVLFAGGAPSGVGELYDPATDSFSPTGSERSSPQAPHRYRAAVRLRDGRVLIAGGLFGSTFPSDAAELYDPSTATFVPTGSMTVARIQPTLTLLDDGTVLVTGSVEGPSSSAELYDPATGTFSSTGSMGEVRSDLTATLLQDGRVLIAGGSDLEHDLSSAELYR